MREMLGDRYKIIHKIGGGGMAIVYLATDLFLDRPVAVKVLRDEYIEDPDFIRHFHKEAKAVAALNHPNIVNIYDFDANGNPIYLVMEYVEGQTIKQIITDEGALSWDQVVDIGIQMATGLAEAHRNHIVHKDVKSHNILIDPSGLVKITDFGIAQMLSNTTITHNKGILGSAHYFSPEQARGEHVDEKTDIYSLGVVLYELATGKVPFTGDNPVTVALKHIQEKPIPPSQINNQIPAELEAIILKCLEKDKSMRYGGMTEVSRALSRVRSLYSASAAMEYTNPQSYLEHQHSGDFDGDETLSLPRDLTQKHINLTENEHDVEESRKKMPKKGRWLQTLIIIFIVTLAAMGTIKIVGALTDKGEAVAVPDVTNMDVEQARDLLKESGFNLHIDDKVFNDEKDKDIILEQMPHKGTKLDKGEAVSVVVSKGPEEIKVPDLSDMNIEDAKKKLAELKLKLGEQSTDYSDDVPKDAIIRQSPEKDKKVNKNDAIDVVISLGKKEETVSMPDLRGKTIDTAKDILVKQGLSLTSTEESHSNSIDKGMVISQSYNPGTKLAKGTGVSLVVSIGKSATSGERGSSSGYQSKRVEFTVPEDGLVVIEQRDGNGTQLVHSGNYKKGDYFSQNFNYTGNGQITVYVNNKQIQQIPVN